MLMEQLDYNFLFRWFVGLSIDEPVWDVTVFTKNRERQLNGEVAEGVFTAVVDQARTQSLLSDEHFTVDGTLIEAWASHKSFQRKDAEPKTPPDDPGNPSVDFHGERRSNDTHQSTTDPAARLARKGAGKEATLSYAGHVLMENRNGIAVQGCVTQATGRAEPEAAWRWSKRSQAGIERPWGPTRATTARNWFRSCVITTSLHTLPASPPLSSMNGPLVIPVT